MKYGDPGPSRAAADWLVGLLFELRSDSPVRARSNQRSPKTAEELLYLRFPPDSSLVGKLVKVEDYEAIVSQTSKFVDIVKGTKIMKDATEKAARFVSELQSVRGYANPMLERRGGA